MSSYPPELYRLVDRLRKQKPEAQRLGQYFVNTYIKGSWPELFYADEAKALPMIVEWLDAYQYHDHLPSPVTYG